MRKKKSRLIISLLTAFIMAFTVIPYMGASNVNAAVQEISEVKTISNIKKDSNGKVVYRGSYDLDSGVSSFSVLLEQTSYDYRDNNWTLTLTDPNGNVLTPIEKTSMNTGTIKWGSKDNTKAGFTTAGKYVLELKCGYSGLGTAGYKLTVSSKNAITYAYKFASLTATETESGMDSVPAVKLEYGKFDSPDKVKELAIFRESNGKIRKLDTSYYTGMVDNIKIDYGTNYTYYIVDLSYVTGTAKTTLSNIGRVDETLTDAIKTALTDSHVTKSNTVKTKDIPMATMWYVRVAKQGVTSAEIEWDAIGGYVSNYKVEVTNSTVGYVKTYEYNGTSYPKLTIYIPYEGTSIVKVTPYYNGVAGVPMETDVTSAKITTAGVNVTKISNTKAAITTYKTTGSTGTIVQQKVGKKYVNVTTGTIKGTKTDKGTTKKTYLKTWTKNKAGTASYRVKSYIIDQGKLYFSSSKTVKPKINKTTYTNYGLSSIRMNGRDVYFRPLSIEYKGSKIKVTGKFYNTWKGTDWWAPNKDSGKVKITFKANHGNGKTVGYKTITSGKMKRWSSKKVTFYLSGAKKAQDLRTVSYSIKTYY